MSELDALVFDAYGTLFDVHAVVSRCETYWPGQGTAVSQLWRSKQLEYTWQRTLMGRYAPFSEVTRDGLGYACEALGLPLDNGRIEALMQAYLQLATYPDVPGALEALRAGGRKMAILTNGSPDMIGPLVRHCGLEHQFDAVLSVDALRQYKTVPAVYGMAVEALGVAPGRVGFVSSNCWDALGAKAFGFTVFWINRGGAPVDRLGQPPDGILGGLGDLPPLLARRSAS